MLFIDLWIAMWDMLRFCSLVFRWGNSTNFFFKNFDWERMYRLKIRNAVIWDSLNCDLKQHRMYLYQSNTYRSHDGLNNNHLKHNVRSLQTDRVLDYPWLKAAGGGGNSRVAETSEDNWARQNRQKVGSFDFFLSSIPFSSFRPQ